MMSSPSQGPPARGGSFGSGYTLPSRQFPVSDPLMSKRVCFYKSGDYTFTGHRMVISVRTFKTFDALLDALSKKVPLAFGVRTITTPRGLHYVKGLDDLLDGGSYVCSDQKRVKAINLKEMSRRQVRWNATRPLSARRRRQRTTIQTVRKVPDRVAIRTPKRLEVIKNRDPSVKRTIILQKRTAPTFDALLDYLSQVLQFPVLRLYSTDGRRVDGLAALILCSGVIVAAGNEPFRLGSYRFQRRGQMAQATLIETSEASIPQAYHKSLVNGRGPRNFSPSSQLYIVDQINKSRYGPDQDQMCENAQLGNECPACIVPEDDDIEKSFCVNQDGSMTVAMKVRLKIKEEEMLRWTTTLSRTSHSKRTALPMVLGSGCSSPDSNNPMPKRCNVSEGESKQANLPAEKSSVGFIEENVCDTDEASERKSTFRRVPTPGPRHVKKKGVQIDSNVEEIDQFTYKKRTSDNDTTEEYHVVRHSSSNGIPKQRKKSSNNGVAEVLQVKHDGFGVTEGVMHIYESQGCCDAYLGNEECSVDSSPLDGSFPAARPAKDKRQSLGNDCDIDCSWQPPVVDRVQNEEILSLSSEPLSSSCRNTNNFSNVTDNLAKTMSLQEDTVKANEGDKKNKAKHEGKQRSVTDRVDKNQNKATGDAKNSKNTSSEKLSNKAGFGKKSSADIVKNGQKRKATEKSQGKKIVSNKALSKEKVTENNKSSPTKSANKVAPYNGHNVNVPDTKTATNKMKKSISDILKPKSVPVKQKPLNSKPKVVNKNAPKKSIEVGESSAVVPSLNPSPSEIHQYVENWLEKVSPEAVPYTEEDLKSHSNVSFQLGDDSESEDKNHSQLYMDQNCTSSEGILKNSTLSVPFYQSRPIQAAASMPTITDPCQDVTIKQHKSDMAINCVMSLPKDTLRPVLRQICSSVQCIHTPSNTNARPRIPKSTSLPDFSAQVASVFGSSSKAFLSFLSMMTLSRGSSPRISSEALLIMEALQKIASIDNEEKQRASLEDLQSRASAQLKEQWQQYQIRRGRSESELLSSKISQSGMDAESGNVHSELGGLMEELNMPEDLRAEVSSVIQEAMSFCPAGMEQNQVAKGEGQNPQCTDVSEKSSHDNKSKANSPMQTEAEKSEGSLEEALTLEGQRSGEVTTKDEDVDAKQEDSDDNISDGEEEPVDSAVEDQESDLISGKSDMETGDKDQLDRDTAPSEKAEEKGEVSQESEEESDSQKQVEEDTTEDAGENLDGRESKSETSATIGGSVPEEATFKNLLDEALYLKHGNRSCDEAKSEKLSKYSSEDRCVDEKCDGIQSELETEEGENGGNLVNPAGISQELLDFVNSALLSSSLIFTYDSLGNLKVAPNVKSTKKEERDGRDSAYGFNCLPSPNTSELTDYRPESLESGGYKTQESLDIVTEGEDSDQPFPVCMHSTRQEISSEKESLERVESKLSHTTRESKDILSSKVSREDLSCSSAASSLKADTEHAPEETEPGVSKPSPDGVLIDQGRWLLKENHLIRRSPPESLGMYGHLDNTSVDTSQPEDSPTHYQPQANPLTALSSSELEEMARPITPKCTYYNMPHGSDSDPFLEAPSDKSEKNCGVGGDKRKAQVETIKTWARDNGSLSSFASVEFKMPDRRVHPEAEAAAVVQARRTSSGGQGVVQAQGSSERLRGRCNRFCPIL